MFIQHNSEKYFKMSEEEMQLLNEMIEEGRNVEEAGEQFENEEYMADDENKTSRIR